MTQLRYAVRSLARTPVVTLVVILSLGLGIGSNTGIFTVFSRILIQRLPVADPDGLVVLHSPAEFKGGYSSNNGSGDSDSIFSYPVMRELEKQPEGLTAAAGFRNTDANIAYGNEAFSGAAMLVSGRYFELLGVRPMFGRLVEAGDDGPGGANPVAVLSYGYWRDRLGGERGVLNQTLRVNGHPYTIVGVAPREFTGTTLGSEPNVYVPIAFAERFGYPKLDRYDAYWIYLLGRRKPGLSIAQAQTALNTVYAPIAEAAAERAKERKAAYRERLRKSRLTLVDGSQGQSHLRREAKTPLIILMITTGLVLLIAMANAANLMLARSAERKKELAVRAALGAGRGAIARQLLTEAVMLATAGGLAGIFFAYATLRFVLSIMADSGEPSQFLSPTLEWPMLLFALGVSVVTGLLFGMHPAWEASGVPVFTVLKDDSGKASSSRQARVTRRLLVSLQVAISAFLLIPTGLFLKSLVNLLGTDLGMNTENVITFRIAPAANGYEEVRGQALLEQVEGELAALPGVRNVTASMVPLISGSNWGNSLTVEGYPSGPDQDTNSRMNAVSPGFFSNFGVPRLMGREFTARDGAGAPKVAVVNETFVKHFFGERNPLGHRFVGGWGDVTPNIEIVGVVKDSHYAGVREETPRLYYVPWQQEAGASRALSFYVRTAAEPGEMMPQIRKVMQRIDSTLPLEGLRTFDEQIARNLRGDRVTLQLAGIFAFLATGMAMLGLYGVMAHGVAQRTREIGIRRALGAGAGRIAGLVLREVGWIFGIGLVVGVPAAVAVSRLVESQLYGVTSRDFAVMGAALAALLVAGLLAALFPARKALRVNPVEALHYE